MDPGGEELWNSLHDADHLTCRIQRTVMSGGKTGSTSLLLLIGELYEIPLVHTLDAYLRNRYLAYSKPLNGETDFRVEGTCYLASTSLKQRRKQ